MYVIDKFNSPIKYQREGSLQALSRTLFVLRVAQNDISLIKHN